MQIPKPAAKAIIAAKPYSPNILPVHEQHESNLPQHSRLEGVEAVRVCVHKRLLDVRVHQYLVKR